MTGHGCAHSGYMHSFCRPSASNRHRWPPQARVDPAACVRYPRDCTTWSLRRSRISPRIFPDYLLLVALPFRLHRKTSLRRPHLPATGSHPTRSKPATRPLLPNPSRIRPRRKTPTIPCRTSSACSAGTAANHATNPTKVSRLEPSPTPLRTSAIRNRWTNRTRSVLSESPASRGLHAYRKKSRRQSRRSSTTPRSRWRGGNIPALT